MNRIFYGFLLLLALTGCREKRTPEDQKKLRHELEAEVPKAKVREFLTEYGQENPETEVLISTSLGKMKVKLYEDTPLHRANFIRLVKGGYYDNTVFYRILRGFMIQGGHANELENTPDQYTVPAEIHRHHFHKKGALAMARYDDNVNPRRESSGHNFYLVQGTPVSLPELEDIAAEKKLTLTPEQKKLYPEIGGAPTLDEQYTVFGEVTEGLEVLDKIANYPVNPEDRPIKPIYVTMKVLR
ncbi:peptidylprolyl isomerase [Adhaeribacter sp. BT258]|uniref:Type IV secretion system putative lipoprotein virB7 n=1 Tax=Adhaeribacter terrigena TaxID=2793070 RepID=A0ABS1C1D9_9BACT|nr:peptidylprolyl isomerase [Adhaeribacter terrigena]MBK0403219.1 peptidylprolyl isomerase [Adhaeribacter terrigena]